MCQPLTSSRRVDAGIPLREVLAQHDAWLREQGILGKVGAYRNYSQESVLAWRLQSPLQLQEHSMHMLCCAAW